jgi:putative endonuclease
MNEKFVCIDGVQSAPGAYVVIGDSGKYMYKGCARDLKARLSAHIGGHVTRTRNRRPLEILHIDYTSSYTDALQREKWLKSGHGRKWLKDEYAWVVACPPLAENGRHRFV